MSREWNGEAEEASPVQDIGAMRAADIRFARYAPVKPPQSGFVEFFREKIEHFRHYRSEVNAFFARLFPAMDVMVLYRSPGDFPGHVFTRKPNERHPYYVLFTAGMSHVPMPIPKNFRENRQQLERAELFMLLPPMFCMGRFANSKFIHTVPWRDNGFIKAYKCLERFRFADNGMLMAYPLEEVWPFIWLKKMAKLPYRNRNWIGHKLVACDVGAINTWQSGGIFLHFGQLISQNGQLINLYCCVPLYPEEVEYLVRGKADTPQRREARERLLHDLP